MTISGNTSGNTSASTPASTRESVVVAFDVDGTITRTDCVRPFLERLGGRRSMVLAVARRPVETVVGGVQRDRDRLKQVLVGGVYRGRQVDEVDETGRAFARVVSATMLRADVIGRLRWHQGLGHRTVIVSASMRSYLVPLAESLGIDHVMCTEVAAADGRYLAHLDGGNCRGDEKAVRLRAWMVAEQLGDATLWAYGDSSGDRAMLAAAHHPVWVRGTTVQPVPPEIAS